MMVELPARALSELLLVFSVGAALVAAAESMLRALLLRLLEPAGPWFDRWRRPGSEPERDLALLAGNLLILWFVLGFWSAYHLPAVLAPVPAGVWMLRLHREIWVRLRNSGDGPAQVHRRAFFHFHFGTLTRRFLVLSSAVALYLLVDVTGAVTTLADGAVGVLDGWIV